MGRLDPRNLCTVWPLWGRDRAMTICSKPKQCGCIASVGRKHRSRSYPNSRGAVVADIDSADSATNVLMVPHRTANAVPMQLRHASLFDKARGDTGQSQMSPVCRHEDATQRWTGPLWLAEMQRQPRQVLYQ
jgi:hypothetical protein